MWTKDVKLIKWTLLVLVILGCASGDLSEERLLLNGLGLDGFELEKPLVVYNRTNIFDYLNGEAEAYLPLGFRLLYSQNYRSTENDVLMIVDTYDMGAPEGAKAAFDLYTQKKGSEIQALGDKAWTDSYFVLFRKGNFFFRVWPDPYQETDAKPGLADLLNLSREINAAF